MDRKIEISRNGKKIIIQFELDTLERGIVLNREQALNLGNFIIQLANRIPKRNPKREGEFDRIF